MTYSDFNRNKSIEDILDNKLISLGFVDFFLGDKLGSGCYRHVFEYNPDPLNWVIKIDVGNNNSNVLEYSNYRQLEYTKHAKWFAPCGNLSNCGKILMQRRCKSLKTFPTLIPSFFTDFK